MGVVALPSTCEGPYEFAKHCVRAWGFVQHSPTPQEKTNQYCPCALTASSMEV
jgi:hypothetical protein